MSEFETGAGEGPTTGRGRRPKRYADTLAKPERKAANRKLGEEYAAARVRAKYGPTGEPAPVTVRRLGDV